MSSPSAAIRWTASTSTTSATERRRGSRSSRISVSCRRYGEHWAGSAPDIVFAPYLSSNGMVAALAWRGPLVVSARGGDVLRQAGYLPGGAFLHRRMMRFVCRRARRVHAVSDEIAAALVADGRRDRADRVLPFRGGRGVVRPRQAERPPNCAAPRDLHASSGARVRERDARRSVGRGAACRRRVRRDPRRRRASARRAARAGSLARSRGCRRSSPAR